MYRRDAFASAGLTRAARWTRAELSQRDNSHQLLRRLLLVAAAGLLSAGALSAQQIEVNLGIAKYRNSLQQSGANPGSTAIFDGNIGKAGAASTPNDGAAHYLVRSSFGQPVQTALLRSPDFNFGAKIPAPAGASLAFAPTIDPAGGAFYLASEKQLIASGSGFTTIVWKDASGNPSVTSTYLISDLPSQPPVNIYWTEINQVATLAPPIDFPGLTVTIHYNSLILPEHLFLKGGSLRAQGRLGQAILEYRNSGTGAFVGLEVVKIKPYLPEVDAARDIGAYLAPKNPTANSPGRALLARGQNATPPYAYQHNHAGKVDDGILFATRETLAGEKLEVFWTEKRLNGVVWPYEMAEYTPAWPANFEDIARRIYQTHNSDGSITHAPAVVIPSSTVGNVVFHWNLAIPESLNPATGQSINLWLDQTRNLYAANQTGRILLHYLGATSDLIGVQLVRVKPYLPDVASGAFNIGDQLHPNVENAWDASVPTPFVSRGTEGTEDKNLLYQHPVAGPFQGNVYAIQKATDETKVEVFWKRRGLSNIEWLYEMRRYTADWPFKIPAKYQLYVRAPGPVFGPAVVIPSDKSANRMTFQEPPAHASDVSSSRFSTISAGWSLLRYRPTNGVSFQVVRSILHTDALVYNGQQPARAIGTEITEPTHQGPLVGYIHAPEGNKFDSQTHQGVTADRSANAPAWLNDWTTGQIFPVNTGPLEVWWSNLNQGVQWPSFVRRYDAQWLGVTDTIIIASQKGTGPIDQNLFKDFHYYYQNDPTLAGFNPNDEHALISGVDGGQGIFALRDDLGTAATSLPYTMLKYRNPANNQWRFRVYQVVAEKAPILFNYPGLAGNLIQPPAPLVDLCTSLDSGVSGPFWKDRKGQFWAKAAGDNGGTSQITMHWFYSASDDYYFPTGLHSRPTQCIPWLDQRPGGTAGVPTDVHYAIQWPTQVPTLNVGETLITDKKGLPVINGQCSVSVLYQQAAALGKGDSVALITGIPQKLIGRKIPSGFRWKTRVRGQTTF